MLFLYISTYLKNKFNDINVSKFQLLKKNSKFVAYHQTTARVPPFENNCSD
jgi:hypothetical protein